MTAVKHLEYQITRQLMRRREQGAVQQGAVQQGTIQQFNCQSGSSKWADRLIAILALTTGLLVLGSFLEELLWAAVAATTLLTLR
jgi:hypothetical protein